MNRRTYDRLCVGGWLVASSDRAARAFASEFHRQRADEGLTAWVAPEIRTWKTFVEEAWQARATDSRMVLTTAQEQSLWEQILVTSPTTSDWLDGPRHRIARLAREAHELLCAYSPRCLDRTARSVWLQDAEVFSEWLTQFDACCRRDRLISAARLPLELISLLRTEAVVVPAAGPVEGAITGPIDRPALMLVGFDRLAPVQQELLECWGHWQIEDGEHSAARVTLHEEPSSHAQFHQYPDTPSELAACVEWCSARLAANHKAKILILSQNIGQQRGAIERAFRSQLTAGSSQITDGSSPPAAENSQPTTESGAVAVEFSLGVPLSRVPLAQGALLLLRWLTRPLLEHELDWLFSTGQTAADTSEAAALQRRMRALRRAQKERVEWPLDEFITEIKHRDTPFTLDHGELLEGWTTRMSAAATRLADAGGTNSRATKPPMEWAALVSELLETENHWGYRALSSAEHQTIERFNEALDVCASLGFSGLRMTWEQFHFQLLHTLDEILFSLESRDAPILIVGPAESAGLDADGIWFLGADDAQWPAPGTLHPLLPTFVQREAGMPHATTQSDWEMARSVTVRLLASAPEVHFSTVQLRGEVETTPSRLIQQLAGQPLPLDDSRPQQPESLLETVKDFAEIPYSLASVKGGAQVLTLQSLCPFRAFAATRLMAQNWNPAQVGLTPSQRGQLLHEAMRAVWAGRDEGALSTLDDLRALVTSQSVESFLAPLVDRLLSRNFPPHLRSHLPARHLAIERDRLIRLITQWLQYESRRAPFEVVAIESKAKARIANLEIDIRLDRMDRLNDGSLLVIDYKTGMVSPKDWELPRPADVQLPLYGGFGLTSGGFGLTSLDKKDDGEEKDVSDTGEARGKANSFGQRDQADEGQGPKNELAGVLFAQIRPGTVEFSGKVFDAAQVLGSSMSRGSSLAKNQLTLNDLEDWRDAIEQLAHEFVRGRAVVDPQQPPKTCERCGLQVLCRISEAESMDADEEVGDGTEEANSD